MDDREVLVPYKITLLSNIPGVVYKSSAVLVPYKITLLSNGMSTIKILNQF